MMFKLNFLSMLCLTTIGYNGQIYDAVRLVFERFGKVLHILCKLLWCLTSFFPNIKSCFVNMNKTAMFYRMPFLSAAM